MKAQKLEIYLYSFFNLGGGWVVKATPWSLSALPLPRKRLGIHYIGGWLGPGPDWKGAEKSRRHRDSIPGPFTQ